MTRRIAVSILLLTIAVSASADEIRGAWTADASEKKPGKIHVQMNRSHHQLGQTMDISAFSGLSEAQIRAASQTPVTFALRREAGTVTYRGTFEAGFGAGQFTFAPNESYLEAVRALGVEVTPRRTKHLGKPVDERLLLLAVQDVSTDFIRSMQAEGYRVSLDQYLEFRIFNVTPALVRELQALGYRDVSAGDLVAAQIHRVTPHYIREMTTAGFRDLTLEDLVATRIHNVTPELARALAEAGYPGLGIDELTAFGIHRVTPEYIRAMREAGYTDIPARKLVEMKIHRVTPEFIRELREAGYTNVPVDKLIAMRIHGVDAIFARRMNGM